MSACPKCDYDPYNPSYVYLDHIAHLEADLVNLSATLDLAERDNARLTAERDRLRAALEAVLPWLENYYTEAPPDFEIDVDMAREALAEKGGIGE